MKTLVMFGPGSVQINDAPQPVRKNGEALLQVRYVGLCGTDLNLECPAQFVPVEVRQTGTRGAEDGTRQEA